MLYYMSIWRNDKNDVQDDSRAAGAYLEEV